MKILLVLPLLLSLSVPAFAAKVNLLRNVSLSPSEGKYYEVRYYFEESRPDEENGNSSKDGCSFHARSEGNFLFTGPYTIAFEEETGPVVPGGRWWRQYTVLGHGLDMRVTCHARAPVTDVYVDRVMGGWVRVER
jgi:hypothetical protein